MAKKRPSSADASDDPAMDRIQRPLTLVAQVEQMLRDAIAAGQFPGDRLPTEVELAEQLGVSRETVRRATESLADEGLLVKFRRKGTFLRRPDPMRLDHTSAIIGYLQADYGYGTAGVDSVTRGISGLILQGALEVASGEGFQLLVERATPGELRNAFRRLQQTTQPRGLIFASVGEEKLLRQVTGLGVPTVVLDHDVRVPQISTVRDDSATAAAEAVQYLASVGHRRIALAYWNQVDLNPWRLEGYRTALRKLGLPRRRSWELPVELSPRGAEEVVRDLLALSPRPTALLCFNNSQARQVIEELNRNGLEVPGDLSVLGGGGEVVPGLTCHQADWYSIGETAVRLVLRLIAEGVNAKPQHELIAHGLQEGKTVASPASSS